MDIYLNKRERDNKYFFALGQSAAYNLIKVADIVSERHIKDYFIKARFKNEVKLFTEANLQAITKAKNDNECKTAINNIKEECRNINRQGDMLSMETAKIFLTVSMEKNKKGIGYLVNFIGVGTSLLQMYGGFGLAIKSGFVIGKLAGANLILTGASNSVEYISRLLGKDDGMGLLEQGYIYTASFLGFNEKFGSIAYHSMEASTSLYGVFALSRKPEAWRLFKFIPNDYYRNVSRMSNAALLIKFGSAGNKIRIIDSINSERND